MFGWYEVITWVQQGPLVKEEILDIAGSEYSEL